MEQTIQETNEQKKEYLRSYRAAVKREERILEDIQELRASKAFPAAGLFLRAWISRQS